MSLDTSARGEKHVSLDTFGCCLFTRQKLAHPLQFRNSDKTSYFLTRTLYILLQVQAAYPFIYCIICFKKKKKKGQCHEIFDFWFFSRISFPQAPEYTIRVFSNFFENSRRYSQLKVCHRCQRHRWQMQKIFNHKNFNYLVWTPVGSIFNIQKHFCLQVHFKVSAA